MGDAMIDARREVRHVFAGGAAQVRNCRILLGRWTIVPACHARTRTWRVGRLLRITAERRGDGGHQGAGAWSLRRQRRAHQRDDSGHGFHDETAGKAYEYHIFDGAGHGFLRGQDNSPANLAAAQQAWPKTVAFFREKLGK
jgi:hypothetical protein